jgi:hypothetical protein
MLLKFQFLSVYFASEPQMFKYPKFMKTYDRVNS